MLAIGPLAVVENAEAAWRSVVVVERGRSSYNDSFFWRMETIVYV
jgi:hypothetical protein